mgnify:FL=1
MLGEEKLRLNMQFAYEVGKLFVKAGCSSTELGAATEIPKATIKRCLKTVRERGNDILLLLPDISEEELLQLQEKINEQTKDNKQLNRWTQGISFEEFKIDIERVGDLYRQTNRTISDDIKSTVVGLVVNGEAAYRAIATSQGISLGSVAGIMKKSGIKKDDDAKGSSHK